MIEILKEFWYRRKIQVYRKLISKCTEERRTVNQKQEKYNRSLEKYQSLYGKQKEI